jgi:hypothetical protein
VLDAHHDDLARLLAQPVEHPVGAATRGPHAGRVAVQRLADTPRLLP